MAFWLMKTEPSAFSVDDLKKAPQQTTFWDGVRNYQARNFICQMQLGEQAFFYHSSCEVPSIVAIVEIVKMAAPDPTAINPHSPYYDAKSSMQKPRWFGVEVKLSRQLQRPIALNELRAENRLNDLLLLRKGNRLSIIPMTPEQWQIILDLE